MKISSYFGASFLIGMILLSSPVVLAGGASNEESKEDSNKKTNSLPLNKGQNLAVDKSKKSNADQQKIEAKKSMTYSIKVLSNQLLQFNV